MTAAAPLILLAGKTPRPFIDHHCITALENAMNYLAFQRFIAPDSVGDPSVQVHLLTPLIELAQNWRHQEIERARQAGASWADIGRLLGVPAAAARAQHAPGRTPPAHPNAPHHPEVLPFDAH